MKKNFKAGIYEIINKINDKKYIGSSIDLENRRRAHFSELTRKIHGNAALQNSYNKHGFENFKFNILFYCNKKDSELFTLQTNRGIFHVNFLISIGSGNS